MALNDVKEIQIPDNRYRELEYIHFSGTEYIDTGYQPTNTTQFTMTVKYLSIYATAYNGKGYMGVRNRYGIGHNSDGTYFFGLGNWATTTIACDTTNFHTISIRPNGFGTNIGYKIDNASWVDPGNVSFVNGGTGTCIIGGANSTDGVIVFIQEDVSSAILIENTTEVRNYKPVQRKSDSVCGLYDTVNNIFYPMVGTNITTTAAGPIVHENMPMYVKKIESNNQIIWGSQSAFPYRRLEYLSFNGTDNYITSPFSTKVGYYREITMTLDEYANDDMRPFFVYDGSVTNAARRWGFILGTSQGFRVSIGSQWSGSGSYPLSTYWPLNTKRTVGLRTYLYNSNYPSIEWSLKNENGSSLATGTVTNSSSNTITSQAPFIMAGSTTGSSPEKYVKGKLYGVVERTTNASGTLLHNYVPAQRKSDGVCGIYDTVDNEFRVMNGSDVTSAAGPIVDEYWDLTA